MKFTLGQIKKSAHSKPFEFAGDVDVSELEKMNNDIRKIGFVHVKGSCILNGEQITMDFAIAGTMILPCARTLVDVEYPFTIQAKEYFTTSPYYGEDEEEQEIHPVHGEVLDLTPYIKENILLEVPFRVFSENTDASEVPHSGQGWRVGPKEEKENQLIPVKKTGIVIKTS
ncbi:YceD family protein [Paracerasibacillus soli]|uniref:YceD family protein n=1 Tax=Paracerasibacillus soli TaxID=480284 RepID=A0ABU5CP15_9BACI|nr:YceD family protein [Virgibacillus soli]MDY0408091.1 YceD family protein [Virgibacillus soli]